MTAISWGLLLIYSFCAICIGFDKGGVPGIATVGMVSVVSYSDNTAESLALFVPVLFMSDCGALITYRKSIEWTALTPLLCPCLIGLGLGAFFLGTLQESYLKRISGFSLLLLTLVQFKREKLSGKDQKLPSYHSDHENDKKKPKYFTIFCNHYYRYLKNRHSMLISAIFFGSLIGFFTIIANTAGPIAVIYFLHLSLPKLQLNGTRACFFVIVNCVKIPIQAILGNLKLDHLSLLSLLIILGTISTVFSAKYVVPKINQSRFEQLSWTFVIISAVKLLMSS